MVAEAKSGPAELAVAVDDGVRVVESAVVERIVRPATADRLDEVEIAERAVNVYSADAPIAVAKTTTDFPMS